MAVLNEGSDAVIHGELYRVNAAGLNRLDQLEGYPGFYDRTELQLCDRTTALMYHGRLEQVSEAPLIPLGDWDTNPVLHYGSNLDPERLSKRCPDWDGEGLDVQLLAQAQELCGPLERTHLLKEALQALVERESARRLAALAGSRSSQQPSRRMLC
jgi:hypothetical protein